MKTHLLLATCAFLILFTACSSEPSGLETAIEAFEEKNGEDANTDLTFEFKEVKLLETITVLDSMKILHYSAFKDSFNLERNYIDTFYTSTMMTNMNNDKQMAKYDSILSSKANASTKKLYEKAKADLMSFSEQEKKKLVRYTGIKSDYDRYVKADKDKVLGKLYEAKYLVTNPETNKKQGKSRKYFFNADETEVLHIAKG